MTAREALKELRDNLEIHLKASPMYSTDHCTINSAEVAAMIAEADEVLAKPERNCDVGTAEEQYMRFRKYCFDHMGDGMDRPRCSVCPLGSGKGSCKFDWEQMPYESERKGEGNGSK